MRTIFGSHLFWWDPVSGKYLLQCSNDLNWLCSHLHSCYLHVSWELVYNGKVVDAFQLKEFCGYQLLARDWSGKSVVISGSGLLSLCSSQTLYCCTRSEISLFNPGHQTDLLASLRHLVIPWCSSWIISSISTRMEERTTILDALSINCFIASLSQYLSDHPQTGSTACAFMICWGLGSECMHFVILNSWLRCFISGLELVLKAHRIYTPSFLQHSWSPWSWISVVAL